MGIIMDDINPTNEIQPIDPKEFEESEIKRELNKPFDDAADWACWYFKNHYPSYVKQLRNIESNKELRRLAETLVGFPIEMQKTPIKTKEAQEACSLGLALLHAKAIMRNAAQLDIMEESINKDIDNATNTVDNETSESINQTEQENENE